MTGTHGRLRTGWTLYAGALTFGVIAGEVHNSTAGPGPDAVAFANWILSAALLTSLWGYALRHPLGTPGYWRWVFWIVLLVNAVMLVPVLLLGIDVAAIAIALELLVVPAYVGAYRYAYRSSELWEAAS